MKKLFAGILLVLSGGIVSAQWTKLPLFTSNDLLDVDFPDPGLGVVVGTKGAAYLTSDGGSTWIDISPEKDINFTSVEVVSSDVIFISGYKYIPEGGGITKLFATQDGGKKWDVINSYDGAAERTMVRCSDKSLFLAGAWKGLQRSVNEGTSWDLLYKGGGNIILDQLEFDASNPRSIFVFGNIGGFFTYSSTFKHADKDGRWYSCDAASFGSSAAFTSAHVMNDTIILFQNFFKSWMPNDTNNISLMAFDFVKDDVIPGGGTGDTVWHFKTKILNRDIRHYVSDCHFFSNTGPGFSVDMVGNINKTKNGGIDWEQVYTGRDTLNSLCMISETDGYVVGNKGTVVKLGSTQGIGNESAGEKWNFTVFPNPARDKITLSARQEFTQGSVRILGQTGQEFLTCPLKGNSIELDISGLASGVYYVVLSRERKIETVPLIKN